MFRSSLLCRGTVVGLWVVTGSLLAVATGRTVLYYLVPAFALWLFLHLSNMKIEIADGCLIRQTGNIFKHKSIIISHTDNRFQTLAASVYQAVQLGRQIGDNRTGWPTGTVY